MKLQDIKLSTAVFSINLYRSTSTLSQSKSTLSRLVPPALSLRLPTRQSDEKHVSRASTESHKTNRFYCTLPIFSNTQNALESIEIARPPIRACNLLSMFSINAVNLWYQKRHLLDGLTHRDSPSMRFPPAPLSIAVIDPPATERWPLARAVGLSAPWAGSW